ncbi:MAG TPA: PIN domain-containing protein [Dehalococcoidia bacterium]
MNGSPAYLLDSNIIVYAFDARDVLKRRRAIEVVNRLAKLNVAAVSPQILGETYVSLTHRSRVAMGLEEAERAIWRLVSLFEVFDLSIESVREAIRISRLVRVQYWDALLISTARLNGLSFLLSEDMQDGQTIEGVRIVNPLSPDFDLGALS